MDNLQASIFYRRKIKLHYSKDVKLQIYFENLNNSYWTSKENVYEFNLSHFVVQRKISHLKSALSKKTSNPLLPNSNSSSTTNQLAALETFPILKSRLNNIHSINQYLTGKSEFIIKRCSIF